MCARLLALFLLAAFAGAARADDGPGPLRLTLACQDPGRTKACPTFLRGFIDETTLLLAAPRASAQVTLYVTAAPVANADRLHLRFVGQVRGAPETIELDVDVDTRGTDDEQRAQLRPAFLRGVALYVAALHPDAVAVELVAPAGAVAAPRTTPWGVDLNLSGYGSWTGPYRSASAYVNLGLSRVTPTTRWSASLGANGGLSRSPEVGGVSFDTNRWSTYASTSYGWHLNPCYALQLATTIAKDDPHGQYRYAWGAQGAIEWDRYPSDDPRGNVLAVAYSLGYTVDGYNFPNVLRQRFAHYAEHAVAAFASVRKDKVSFRLSVRAGGEVVRPDRRYTLSASPGVEIQLGDHVDLGFDLSMTRRELPEFVIPEDDPQAVGRADYAEPTSIYGSFNVRLHWDASNGARNNRFTNL